MSEYRRLVSAMTALHQRLEDCEVLLDKAVRVVVAQGRTIVELEEMAFADGEESEEEGQEFDDEFDDEGEEEPGPPTQTDHEADFDQGPAQPEDPAERERMNKISTGKPTGLTQAEIQAMMV